ncbi:hypothetical protein FRX31_025560 [Thalictrum thalictroides]|uniref:Uncharacterized protein n=1 Tax=Thalictrum thalictroides TaxID=46969 RepID=A0A7J6VJT0_THATH|nr:hypothetical protein FRX31_025560 [Thalictrum thalictroides]
MDDADHCRGQLHLVHMSYFFVAVYNQGPLKATEIWIQELSSFLTCIQLHQFDELIGEQGGQQQVYYILKDGKYVYFSFGTIMRMHCTPQNSA